MIKIRKVKAEDCKDLFKWRNDKTTIKMSHNSHEIPWNEHKKWFNATINDSNKLIFICEDSFNYSKIGVVRFDINKDNAFISINLSPIMRGKGKSSLCLNASVNKFIKLFPDVLSIHAEVKKENIVSSKLFIKCGFKLYKIDNYIYNYQYKIR